MGRIIEIKNQFVISDLNVHGYTTEDNVYLHLNSKNVDLVEFKRSAIRYIGLSLSDKKMETYFSAYREISEKFGIKINVLEDEKNIVEATPSVEVSGNDDVVTVVLNDPVSVKYEMDNYSQKVSLLENLIMMLIFKFKILNFNF